MTPSSSAMANELYPNRFAARSRGYPPSDGSVNGMSDPTCCAQCGFPIKDRQAAKQCDNCASDNFEGEAVSF